MNKLIKRINKSKSKSWKRRDKRVIFQVPGKNATLEFRPGKVNLVVTKALLDGFNELLLNKKKRKK